MPRMRSSHRLLVLVSLLLGSASACKDPPAADTPAALAKPASAAGCTHAPECVPPRAAAPDDDRRCAIGTTPMTCAYCGERGGLMECVDTDRDGCLELVRKECGQNDGCARKPGPDAAVACKPTAADEPANQFGAQTPGQELPAGFVAAHKSKVFPVKDGKLTLVVRTRDHFVGPTTWSVGLTGAGLNLAPAKMTAEYIDVSDDYAVLRQVLDVRGFDANASDVTIVYTVSDYKQDLSVKYEQISLRETGP